VLSYHKIGAPPAGGWETWYYVSQRTFRQQLQTLIRAGWHPIDHVTFVAALDRPDAAPERGLLVTFDDGYASLVREAVPVMEDLGVAGVVFVPTAYIGGSNDFDRDNEPREPILSWDELRELGRRGVSVQSHGVRHAVMSDLAAADQRRELVESRRTLEDGLGSTVDLFAFPYGDEGGDPAATTSLLETAGYRAAFGYGGAAARLAHDDRFRLPRLAMGPDVDVLALLS
jgi:peptidoglycan/xylan/chitin deacetylase (PgdA/CDA1 family)